MDRTITSKIIKKYLPKNTNLPAISNIPIDETNEKYNERDILYKILFDLKNDVTEMKKIIDSILNDGSEKIVDAENKGLLTNNDDETNKIIIKNQPSTRKEKFHEVTEVVNENESLSIESKEKELIIKALYKNKNKRKYAAKDLGISERTLYRKIKYYNLEKN